MPTSRRPGANRRGFAPILMLIVIVVVIAAGFFLYANYLQNRPKIISQSPEAWQSTQAPQVSPQQTAETKTNPYLGVPCQSNPSPKFTHDFTESNLIAKVTPPSLVASKSQDRAFLWIDSSKTPKVPIYAPVDADLIRGVYKTRTTKGKDTIDYDLHFQVSCEVWFFINHISDPENKIKNFFPKTPASTTASENYTKFSPPLHFNAGDLIGYTTGTFEAHNFDFAVFDLNNTNKFVGELKSNDTRFNNFICPFDIFPENIKSSYYQKLIPDLIPESNCKSNEK